jgi:hypothetical protein
MRRAPDDQPPAAGACRRVRIDAPVAQIRSRRSRPETVLPMRDGLPKLKDFPAELGGSGVAIPE